ncbi:MAG: hypothetical protein GC159_00375 [Phycisphaera sp.]|nr:hypothetical protein [Phycisphaera sp.]
MKPWHMRSARGIVYAAGLVAMAAVAIVALMDSDNRGVQLVTARQLYGLWALGWLIAAMLIGPLTMVVPGLPLRPTLMYGRRAVGVMALLNALAHVTCYDWSVLRRDWHEFYTPGAMWVIGLVLGTAAMAIMLVLGFTSRDASVKKMGGRKWKRVHSLVYVMLFVVLAHAVLVGTDFGVNHGPDVTVEADFGALVTFSCLTVAWVVLALLRRSGRTWRPAMLHRDGSRGG